jgi:hypothetical protein
MPKPLPETLEPLAYPKAVAFEQEAYDMCLQAEAHHVAGNLACIRLVSWMLQKAPSTEGRNAIARAILDDKVQDVKNVTALGRFYIGHCIRICACREVLMTKLTSFY